MPVRSPTRKAIIFAISILIPGVIGILLADHWIWSRAADLQAARRWLLTTQFLGLTFGAVLLGVAVWRLLSRSERRPVHRPIDELNALQASLEAGWVADEQGRIVHVTEGFCKLVDLPARALLGRPFKDLVHPGGEAAFNELLSAKLDARRQAYFCLRGRGTAPIWVSAFIQSTPGQGLVGLAVQIPESPTRVRPVEERLRVLYENSPIAVWEEDFSEVQTWLAGLQTRGVKNFGAYFRENPTEMEAIFSTIRVLDVNQYSVKMFGAASKEELLANARRVIGMPDPDLLYRLFVFIANGGREFEDYVINYRLDGAPLNVLMRWIAAPGFEADLSRVLVSLIDVTLWRQAEEKLRQAEARYRQLVEQVNVVMYTDRRDSQSSNIYTSPQAELLTGYKSSDWEANPALWLKIVHPEDEERVRVENDRTNRTGDPFILEYRLVRKDGQVVWVRDQAVLVSDPISHEKIWQGVIADITERKLAEEALQQSEIRFRLLLQSQGEGTLLFNQYAHLVFVNPAAEELFGVQSGRLVGRSLMEFADAAAVASLIEHTSNLPSGKSSEIEMQILPKGRTDPRWLTIALSPWYEATGQLAGGLALCRDITDKKLDESRLRYQSTHDALTGLFNRHYFEECLASVSRGKDFPVSLVVGDMDRLKEVNDRYGHTAGDECLRQVAVLMRDSFRGSDVIARIGGDEYAVLLPGTDEDATRKAIDRLRSNAQKFNQDSPEQKLSLSLGFATAYDEGSLTTIFHRADLAMYQEKAEKNKMRPQ